MLHNEHLNLARKWRSKNFDQIIGQELSVKMLRNSLYLNQLFPVYLFSGQRGCGKTSMARIFASAINCEKLAEFQKQPKQHSVPCLTCASCIAMSTGQHPDFIEIDAASHTGVDNVRNIIESSSFLPLMGRKKIYLIDEAHMLSKAAFNALLKVLEEPSASALFILATTDVQKVIETVRSRCFQLLFKPVDVPVLVQHLKNVCEHEQISFEELALTTIVQSTDGSVRDALNLLEQVRFSSGGVTQSAVASLLGQVDDGAMVMLLDSILNKEPGAVLRFLNHIRFSACSVDFMWHRLLELLRAAIWCKYDITPEFFADYTAQLKKITEHHSVRELSDICAAVCAQEQHMNKTTAKHAFFEMILLQLCQKKGRKGDSDNNSSLAPQAPLVSDNSSSALAEDNEDDNDIEDENMQDARWQTFVSHLQELQDPLVNSIFTQAQFKAFDEQSNSVTLAFAKELIFFNDWLNDTQQLWLPLLQKQFGKSVVVDSQFILAAPAVVPAAQSPVVVAEKKAAIGAVERVLEKAEHAPRKTAYAPQSVQKNSYTQNSYARKTSAPTIVRGKTVSAQELGERAHMLLTYFPGTVTENVETHHG